MSTIEAPSWTYTPIMDTNDDPIRLIAGLSAEFGVYWTLGEIQGGQYDPSSLF